MSFFMLVLLFCPRECCGSVLPRTCALSGVEVPEASFTPAFVHERRPWCRLLVLIRASWTHRYVTRSCVVFVGSGRTGCSQESRFYSRRWFWCYCGGYKGHKPINKVINLAVKSSHNIWFSNAGTLLSVSSVSAQILSKHPNDIACCQPGHRL